MPKIFEGPVPLSQSSLFTYVRHFYDRLGQEAWSHHGLPTHITCHSGIARSYAAMIAAWIDDLAAAGRLDKSEPVYVFEMGAGMGRLGFGVSRHYQRLHPIVPIVYVVTDYVAANVDAMQANAGIAEEIAAGRMDAAQFDALKPAPLQLRHAHRVLDPRTLKNPICVVANYVIDSLPTDAFWISPDGVQEALVSLSSKSGHAPDWATRDTIDDIETAVSYAPVKTPRFSHAIAEGVLQQYPALGEASINLPHAGLACIDTLQRWSQPDMLLLSADKAYVELDEMRGHQPLHIAHHASISLMANYHAFKLAAPLWKGIAHTSPMRDTRVSYLALRCNFTGTRRSFDNAFTREFADLSPSDRHALTWTVELDKLEIGEILALLRVGAEDPLLFGRVGLQLCSRSTAFDLRMQTDLARCVALATDVYLHLPFDETFVRETAQLLAKWNMYDELDAFGEAMRRRCGPALDLGNIIAQARRMHKVELSSRYTPEDFDRQMSEMTLVQKQAEDLIEKTRNS